MKIDTKYHGVIEVNREDIWKFTYGLPGFQDEKEFVILSLLDNEVYSVLQSVKTRDIGFVITNPFLFFQDYSFKIDDQTIQHLEINNQADTIVYTVLTIQDPFKNTTANLQAPIIMNKSNRSAKQYILNDGNYTTKHSILTENVEKE
jgi:flagellar assembly factor FliW